MDQATDGRFDILFEPVKIGPVTAKNRFFQVPHCAGMGHAYPKSVTAIRQMKARGGWAVVSTEETEIHHTSDIAPALEGRLWEDSDIPVYAEKAAAIHEYDSLAAIELCHNGLHAPNMYSRETPLAPSNTLVDWGAPINARAMDKQDIKNLRRWYVNAAKRAKAAEFDIVYVYAGHDMSILQHFLSNRHNQRLDEYGGSLENRVRLFREVLADTKEAIDDRCAIAVRLSVDELLGPEGLTSKGEGHDIIAMLADEPDLWDVNISGWENDSQTSRFSPEGFQEDYISFVKKLTNKPVVGVGRYTSPDHMAGLIKNSILDFIGAARPSIADPFLPEKIRTGRFEDIRECIGCNICVASDNTSTPIRCTQNPTMGEEWRKGWHPEIIPQAKSRAKILVVGGGPAGLEATRALGQRGCEVTLAEQTEHWGGRVTREASLPGLNAWGRVRDWRLGQIEKMSNVESFLASKMGPEEIIEFDPDHVVLATGSHWQVEFEGALAPEEIMSGQLPQQNGPVVIYDAEGFYLGGLLAEKCALAGLKTIYVTPAAMVSPWTLNTLEQPRIQKRLLELGVTIMPHKKLISPGKDNLQLACVFTGRQTELACQTFMPVTKRVPDETLLQALKSHRERQKGGAARFQLSQIGDCYSPTTIAGAVYAGHRFAREFDEPVDVDVPSFRRESTR